MQLLAVTSTPAVLDKNWRRIGNFLAHLSASNSLVFPHFQSCDWNAVQYSILWRPCTSLGVELDPVNMAPTICRKEFKQNTAFDLELLHPSAIS